MIAAGYDKTPAMLSDHPTLASRVQTVDGYVKALPPQAASWRKPPIADAAKFKELQQKAAALAKTQPDDSKLANSQQLLAALPRSCIIPYTTQDEVQARQAIQQKAEQQQQQPAGSSSSKKKKHHDDTSASATPAAGNQVISSPTQ